MNVQMEYMDNVQSEEIVPNSKGKVKGKVQKSKQEPKVLMMHARTPFKNAHFCSSLSLAALATFSL